MRLLQDVIVIESASVITGPLAGMMLADLGATVIKVEPPSGDAFRAWEGGEKTLSPTFAAYNRGKSSIAVNLKEEEGRRVFRELVATADAVIENSRPGVMERLGVGYEQLQVSNPRLVYCHISGMGTTGPDRDRPTFDAVAQALSGLWSQYTDLQSPEPVGPPAADQLTGIYATVAVLAGLQHRQATGQGVKLDVDMLSSCLAFQGSGLASLTREDKLPTKTSRARDSQSYAFIGSDSQPFAIHLSTPTKFWQGLCDTIEMPELFEDSRFATKSTRIANYDELEVILAEVFGKQPRGYWLRLLASNDVPSAPIYTLAESLEHRQVRAGGAVDTDNLEARLRGLVRSPIAVDGAHLASSVPPPEHAQDTDLIMASLGHSPHDVARLRQLGAVM